MKISKLTNQQISKSANRQIGKGDLIP